MIDTIAVIDSELIERMSMNNADRAFLLLEEGRKTEASIISTHSGGGALNSAVSFARLGCATSALIKIGNDERGRAVLETLKAEGINAGLIRKTDRSGTGASVLISAHDRNAAIFTFRGANSFLDGSDLAESAFNTDLVYVTGLSDGSANIFQDIVDRAASHGAIVAANPGIRQLSARAEAFYKALSTISLLSMNRDEASTLLPRLVEIASTMANKPRYGSDPQRPVPDLMHRGLAASGYEQTLPQFCEAVLALGPECLIITDGKNGAYAALKDVIYFCPSLPSGVVGTAGAGDAFSSTFTFKYFHGTPPAEALQFATVNARSVIGFADTQSGLLRLSTLDATTAAAKGEMPVQTWTKM